MKDGEKMEKQNTTTATTLSGPSAATSYPVMLIAQ